MHKWTDGQAPDMKQKKAKTRNSELRIGINADRDSNKTQCNVRNKPLHNEQNQFYTVSVAKKKQLVLHERKGVRHKFHSY